MSDTLQPIKCPACHKDMVKIFMPAEGINIDVCLDGCGGIFFDNREFRQFDEKAENIDEILKEIEGKEFEKVDESLTRTCPVCGSKMVKNWASSKQEIQVDDCYSCGGKFLDNGELQKIREQFETEKDRSDAALEELYSTVGPKLAAIEAEQRAASASRSIFHKLFRAMIYGSRNSL